MSALPCSLRSRFAGRLPLVSALLICVVSWFTTGCKEWTPPAGKSPLRSLEIAPHESAVEVTMLRLAKGSEPLEAKLWSELDEFALDSESRRKWNANGFRVGVFNGEPPPSLRELIVKDRSDDTPKAIVKVDEPPKPAKADAKHDVIAPGELREDVPTAEQDGSLFNTVLTLDGKKENADKKTEDGTLRPTSRLPKEGGARTHTLFLQPGQEAELQPGGVHDVWSFLLNEDGKVRGKSLTQAQGVWRLSARPRSGATRIKLVPEIQHGEPKSHWVGEDGVFRQQLRKPKEPLDGLTIDVSLQPGQALVIAPLADRPGSLAHYFLGAPVAGELQRRVAVVRVAKPAEDKAWD
ncbi:MAG: hypothetical protein QM811_00280 [Pirellulales bacterium]